LLGAMKNIGRTKIISRKAQKDATAKKTAAKNQ
jgi:hypothetical protein